MSGSCTAIFILVLYDYYRNCQVSGIDGLCFYGDYYIFGTFDFNSKVRLGQADAQAGRACCVCCISRLFCQRVSALAASGHLCMPAYNRCAYAGSDFG